MSIFYFAYGSNLCKSRLESRVGQVSLVGVGTLSGHELRWHKRSKDKSGKLTVAPSSDPEAVVLGALFGIKKSRKPDLDRAEGLGYGYDEKEVSVETGNGEVRALTYVATQSYLDDSLRPYSWYRDLVVSGAAGVGLDPGYVGRLQETECWEDPDPARSAKERAHIPCQPETAKEQFLLDEFLLLAVGAAFQRSRIYSQDATAGDRSSFRRALKEELARLAERYDEPVAEDQHVGHIAKLCDGLSDSFGPVLSDERFRVGTAQKALNLFLKHLWCAGRIAQPPHCPFDRYVIDLLPADQRVAWTRMDGVERYVRLVQAAKQIAGEVPLALWELEAYGRVGPGSA